MPAGTGIFTLLGFAGLYVMIGLLYVLLQARIVARGPAETESVAMTTEPSPPRAVSV